MDFKKAKALSFSNILDYFEVQIFLQNPDIFIYKNESLKFILYIPKGSGAKKLWSSLHFRNVSQIELIQFLSGHIHPKTIHNFIDDIDQHDSKQNDELLYLPIPEEQILKYAFTVKPYINDFDHLLILKSIKTSVFKVSQLKNKVYQHADIDNCIVFPLLNSDKSLCNQLNFSLKEEKEFTINNHSSLWIGTGDPSSFLLFVYPLDLLTYYSGKDLEKSTPILLPKQFTKYLLDFHSHLFSSANTVKIQLSDNIKSYIRFINLLSPLIEQLSGKTHLISVEENHTHIAIQLVTSNKPSQFVNKIENHINHHFINQYMVSGNFIDNSKDLQSILFSKSKVSRFDGFSHIELTLLKSVDVLKVFIELFIKNIFPNSQNISSIEKPFGLQISIDLPLLGK